MTHSNLETLPVELLYQIIDYVDTKTVFLSFSYVCKRFYAVIKNQNKYRLNFRYMSKADFRQVCHLIRPENVTDLILSNGNETVGQIRLFFSFFNIDLFTRLYSVKLIDADEIDLKIFLKHVIICPVVCLSFKYDHEQDLSVETIDLLSSTLEKLPRLQKFEMQTKMPLVQSFRWSELLHLQCLSLSSCTPMQINNLLKHLHQLQTLIVNSIYDSIKLAPSRSEVRSLLKCFRIQQCFLRSRTIQFLLLSTPLLNHLQLTGWTSTYKILEGSSWKTFIGDNLTNLCKFEFSFQMILKQELTKDNIQSLIGTYQTPFWLQQKHCLVTCEYVKTRSTVKLYTIPLCETQLIMDSDSDKIYCSSVNYWFANPNFHTDNINDLWVNYMPAMSWTLPMYFNNIKQLTLSVTNNWPQYTIEYLPLQINLQSLTKLALNSEPNEYCIFNTSCLIADFIRRAPHLRSLTLAYPLSHVIYESKMKWLFAMIAKQIEHLNIGIVDVENRTAFLNQLHHFSSVTFTILPVDYDYFVSYFLKNIHHFHFNKNTAKISVWL